MTFEELQRIDRNTLTVKEVSEFLGLSPQLIRDQASRDPKYLGFPICQAGHSWKIPKMGFIAWVMGQIPIMQIVSSNRLFKGFEQMGLAEGSDVVLNDKKK